MTITLHGTNGITTPAVAGDGSDLTALPAAQLTGTVATSQIADANVTTAKITDANVTTAKIADANVTQGKLADQAVNEAKMQVSNAPTNGYFLSAQSGNTGGLTWAEAGGDPTGESSVTTLPTNGSSITFGSIPDGIKWLRLLVYDFNMAGSNSRFQVRLGSSAEIHSADNDYQSYSTYVTGTESPRATVDGFEIQYYRSENSSNRNFLIFNLYKQAGTNIWISNHTLFVRNGSLLVMGAGVCTVLDSRLTQLVFRTTGNNFSAGNANIQWGY